MEGRGSRVFLQGMALVFNGGRVSVWENEKFLEMMVVTVAQQYECIVHPEVYT